MRWRTVSLDSVMLALSAVTPAVADSAKTITATGTGLVKVVPHNRNSESSIQAAVKVAENAGVTGAMREAHDYAVRYAAAAGLALGGVLAVTDAPNGRYVGFGGPFGIGGSFGRQSGPNQYCGTQSRPVFKRVGTKHRQKLVGFKNVHVCFVPRFAATTLTVTCSAQ